MKSSMKRNVVPVWSFAEEKRDGNQDLPVGDQYHYAFDVFMSLGMVRDSNVM